jgi:YidC/Oxa1 family membrane protein insertase
MKSFFRSLSNLIKFYKIKPQNRKIVFYSENENFYQFFEGLINELINNYNYKIYYVTSSSTDPILYKKNPKIESFYVGNESIKTIFFRIFNSPLMILTMPDLNSFHIKRSPHNVNYIFIPHNVLSLHMVFRKKAFNNYNTFFCSGPHHNNEIEETEKIYNLKKIKTFNFGYYKIDKLLSNKQNKINKTLKTIIIAPSWGESCIIEKIGDELLSLLKDKDWKIIIRPHPDTLRLFKEKYISLKKKFDNYKKFKFEENVSNMLSFHEADLMISDWSGAAFEFAFGLEKPVIFIDLPKKINNSDFKLYKNIPIEVGAREKIGEIVDPYNLITLVERIETTLANEEAYKIKISQEREKLIYNVKNSSTNGAKYIQRLLEDLSY